jgi:tetratricopeptide (TPR) repeat protein
MRTVWSAALLLAAPVILGGQGFGTFKKSLVLERKLPAAVKLPGDAFNVKVSAERPTDTCQKLAADKLQAMVETNLIRFNSQLQLNPDKPDTVITLKVLNCNAQATPTYSTSLTGKNKGQQQQTGVKATGGLSVTYQARTRGGGFVDAEPVQVKYNQDFNQVSNAIAGTKKILSKIPHPGAKHHQDEGEEPPHTIEDILQILADHAAQRVAARLVTTNERVEVLLARGALDDNNRYAEAGQWTKFVEGLETRSPLPNLADDAYRLYNIGVGNEALGYKADSPASAKRYFEQAVVQYRKAGEANPDEKYFVEPVNRIEIALEHYKKLAAPAPSKAAPTKKGKEE